ncbi:MAG: DUF3422 family protein [Rhodomicrobium sp.]
MALPPNHPLRIELNDEVHTRPPEELKAPSGITYLALSLEEGEREASWQNIADLAKRFGAEPPPPGANHFSANLGPFRAKWERHTEYVRYKFIVGEQDPTAFTKPAIEAVPHDWLSSITGRILVATRVLFVKGEPALPDSNDIGQTYFDGNPLIGALIAGGAGRAYTDFRIRSDGFSRLLVHDLSMTPRQAGRTVQRLVEIDTYRMLAFLALPVALQLSPFLAQCEKELAEVTAAMVNAGQEQDQELLARLTKLEAEMGHRQVHNSYRFSGTAAYYELVQRRIAELREVRIEGLQTFMEFMERRLAPAVNRAIVTSQRQDGLSARIARATQLLSTRVDIARGQQNSAILASMNRRARLQLRLQQTVEGLSVAAITYYIVSLIGHLAGGAKEAGLSVDPELVMAASIPIVLSLLAYGVHRLHALISAEKK